MDTLLHRRLHFRSAAAWTPASPTTGGGASPTAWWDANAIAGLSDGDAVSSWTDRVAGTYTATNTGTNRPAYKTGILNAKAVVRFEGASSQSLAFSSLSIGNSWTVFAVMYRSATSNKIIAMANTTTGNGWYLGTGATSVLYCAKTAYGVNSQFTVGYTTGWKVFTAQGDTALMRINGSNQSLQYYNNTAHENPSAIGRHYTNYSTGDIAEIIVYTSALSAADITQVEGYLNTKWAVY